MPETIFAQIAAADPVWILPKVCEDAIRLPSTADIMADDRVKHVRAVSSRRRPFTYNLLDLIDAVLGSVAVEAVAFARRDLFCSSLAAFAPHNCPIKYFVDIGELLDGIEPVSSDGERLVGAPEQLSGNLFAVDL